MSDDRVTIAGRYAVVRPIGMGGMGAVVLATDERLRRPVAIKRVHATGGPDAQRRLRREAKLGASLTHPALVTVFDTFVEDGGLVVVMEYVEGETLADRLERGPLAPAEALAVLEPVADALDHAHGNGIVHRDVKPANVLLGARGRVKLADLGVAVADDVSRITEEGATVGSLPYMAPEQLGPGQVGPPADVYALAAVAFEALTGRRARSGSTPLALARAALEDPAPRAPELPRAAEAALAAGMAPDPRHRPPAAGLLLRELAAALPVAPPEPEPEPEPRPDRDPATPLRMVAPRPPERDRRVPVLLAVLALLVTGGVLAAVLADGNGGAAPERSADRPTATPTATRAATATTTATATATATARATATPTGTAGPRPAAVAAGDDPSTPTGAVRALYERAARDDFDGAYALAGPDLREAFDRSGGIAGTFGTLESIRFKRLVAEGASNGATTVRIATVARHTTRTDRCTGTALAVPDGAGAYRVELSGVSCDRS